MRAAVVAAFTATAGLGACTLGLPAPSLPAAGDIEAALAGRRAGLASVRAQVRAELRGPSGLVRSAQMVLAEAPDRIRIDVMSPFGPTHTLASDGKRLAVYDRVEAVVYRGAANAANLARFTGVPLEISVLSSLVRGLPPGLAVEGSGRVHDSGRNWSWERGLSGGGRLTLTVDKRSLLLRGLTVKGNRPLPDLLVTFDDYRDAGGLRFPHRMEARVEGHGEIELSYERVWRGVAPGDSAFEIPVHHGARRVDMEEMDAVPGLY